MRQWAMLSCFSMQCFTVRNHVRPRDSDRRKWFHLWSRPFTPVGYGLSSMGVSFGSMMFQEQSWWVVWLRAMQMFSSQSRSDFLILTFGSLDMIPRYKVRRRLKVSRNSCRKSSFNHHKTGNLPASIYTAANLSKYSWIPGCGRKDLWAL